MTHADLLVRQSARQWRTDRASGAAAFHRTMPGYAPTPLREVTELADELRVGRVFVKEESARLGLPAFKILGASYAISRALSAALGEADRAMGVEELRAALDGAGPTLIAATDGNHGRAVAHTADLLGLSAVILHPEGITAEARAAIASEGAETIELPMPYDEVVAEAAARAESLGDAALLVQDTAWEGYEQIPQWIVEGYATMFDEADDQLLAAGVTALDLVAVPIGVGSLAQAAVSHHRSGRWTPSVLGVEPAAAPSIITALRAAEPVSVETSPTVMTGLNCGTVSRTAWPVLRDGLDAAVTVGDEDAVRAVRDLEGLGVDAGPCGAATLAGVRALVAEQQIAPDATILLISTEGRSANPIPEDPEHG